MKRLSKPLYMAVLICLFALIGIAFISAPQAKAASVYYMSPSGSDSNSGTIDSPWNTLAYASTKLGPGDTLYLRGGMYSHQYMYWTTSGSSGAPLKVMAYPGETPVFDGYDPNYPGDPSHRSGNPITVQSSSWVTFDGLTFQNSVGAAGIWVGRLNDTSPSSSNITISNCKFLNLGVNFDDHAIYISWGADDIYVYNNYVSGVPGAGVHMFHSPGGSNYHIYNNIFIGGRWGVLVDDGHNDTYIYNNTFYNNERPIQLGNYGTASYTNVVVKNNVFYTTGGTSLSVAAAETNQLTEDNNLYYDTTTSTPIKWGYSSYSAGDWNNYSLADFRAHTPNGQHSIQADPSFTDVLNGDFHLTANSPAVDSGNSVSEVTGDYGGNSRPIGAAYDMGAYEFDPNLLPNPGFEDGSSSPVGWTTYSSNGGTFTWDNTKAYKGSRSIELNGTTDGSSSAYYLTANRVPVNPGKTYLLSGFYTESNVARANYVFLKVYWYRSDGTITGSAGYAELPAGTVSDWTQSSASLVAPSDAATASVYAYLYDTSGTAWFDNVNLSEIADARIAPASAAFDKNVENQSDLSITVIPESHTLSGILNGVSPLVQGTDYTVADNVAVIKKAYLATLPEGNASLTFDFDSGTDPVLSIAVSDTTWKTKAAWSSSAQSLGTSNTGTLSAEFDLTPLDSTVNGTIGYADSSTTVSDWNSPAMIIAMDHTQRYFTVRNGANYESLTQVSYSNGTVYHFRIVPDFSANTYTVYVTPQGGTETMIAQNYAFRSDAPATDDLGQIVLKSDSDDAYKVENHRVIWPTQSAWSAGAKSLGTGNTGVLTTEFDLTPVDTTVNGTIGYADSSTTVNDWSSPAMTIAMDRTQGYFTVRNGTAYDCLTQVSYSNGTKYHFRIAVNFTAKTYTVFVTPEGATETMIAKDYAFRSDAPATDDLGQISLKSDSDGVYIVENHTVTP